MTKKTPGVEVERIEPRRHFAAGDPLDSFGRHGQAVTPYELYAAGLSDLQPAPGGKLIASISDQASKPTRPIVKADFVRFNADGSPDTTFGGIGAVDSIFATVRRIAVRSDGRFYALGSTSETAKSVGQGVPWYVGRFLPDGRPDRAFGRRGFVELDLRNVVSEIGGRDGFGDNRSCFLDTDGRLTLLADYRYQPSSRASAPAVVRLGADGQPDPTFRHGTPFLMNPTNAVYSDPSIAVGKDGSVLVAVVRQFRRQTTAGIICLTPGGEADDSFGSGGYAMVNDGYVESPTAAYASGGSCYFGGAQSVLNTDPNRDVTSILTRLNPNGTIDQNFAGGTLRNESYFFAGALVPLPDGGVLTNGRRFFQRWNADGSPDRAFGRIENHSVKNIVFNDTLYGFGPGVPLREGVTRRGDVRSTVTAISLGGTGISPANLVNGRLTLNGTSAGETLSVGATYTYNRPDLRTTLTVARGFWSRTVPASGVTSLVINADDGDDTIEAILTQVLGLQVVINGGAGRDRIAVYHSSDGVTINGGSGGDRISTYFGAPGAITIHGGPGDDIIAGDVPDSDS